MSVLAKSTYFWRSAVQGVRHSPFIHFIAVLTIAIALFAAGLSRGVYQTVEALVNAMGSAVELTVYLAPEVSAEQAQRLGHQLSAQLGGEVSYVSPEQALMRLRSELGEHGQALDELVDNPLTPSLEVRLPPGAGGPDSLRAWAEQTRGLPGVSAVDYGQEAVERLFAISRLLRWGGLGAFVIVLIATVVIVSATLQLAIFARRDEIEIQKLVGATDRFVRIPFLMEGVLQGALGSGVAIVGLWLFDRWAGAHVGELFSFLGGLRQQSWMNGQLVLQLIAAGCGLGLVGSLIAVGRFLRV